MFWKISGYTWVIRQGVVQTLKPSLILLIKLDGTEIWHELLILIPNIRVFIIHFTLRN